MQFSHLHNHSQFSLLDGAANIKNLFKKAEKDGMPAIALTDHGNMFGVFQFVAEAWSRVDAHGQPKVKPIVGCEFYLVEDRHKRSFTGGEKDKRYHQLLLAKNEVGYKNLVKLTSLGFMEGLYGKYPRIDKELIEQYHEGLIATSCCIGAEIPKTILEHGEEAAEEKLKWWLDLFGDDYYLEVQRHGMPQEDQVNHTILKFADKYNIPVIATNDSHYVDREDYNAHDILLCVNTGEKQSTPVIKDFVDSDSVNKRDYRFGFFNDEFFFKTQKEMEYQFRDIPHTLANTQQIVDKVECFNLKKDILLPSFPLPSGFFTQDDYLEHLTWEGAKNRYHEITSEVEERLRFELNVIKTMGYAGYFLIVSDFISAGKNMGVYIGPGRGSAAGSAVAFCIGITNIDPIKYNLLFERFLNPDRKSMPDIDTDFDDEGRQKVIDYVVDKYSYNQVAHIVTYGTMAAKMSIKDVARVLDLPLAKANLLAKLVPDIPGVSLKDVLHTDLDDPKTNGFNKENINTLRTYYQSQEKEGIVLQEAEKLEGSVRNTGIHAAGIIIAPEDLTTLIPVCTSKDVNLLITQYEGKIIEEAGVIKMDFLGLRTLSILKDAIEIIQRVNGVKINLDDLPLDDIDAYKIYQNGQTNGIFQFESPGMQKYLKELKPDKLEDIIAMNALYRPGPIEYIPDFIRRKKGIEAVTYDLEGMEEYLGETYGITVYQEQVMLLSQKIANFSKGDADTLRKAMGKKQKAILDKMVDQFLKGGQANGHPKDKLQKVWTDWEAFASYAFNKSHSTCYAVVSYHTAYIKAHYPAAFMAAQLNNAGSADKIEFLLKECKRMTLTVLGPSLNESIGKFTVTENGVIRFGFDGIKGMGEAMAKSIMTEREKNGVFKDIFDFAVRINQGSVSKKSLESLAMGGAFDDLDNYHRAQYFTNSSSGKETGIEIITRYAKSKQGGSGDNLLSLFGDVSTLEISKPNMPDCPKWTDLERLHHEKEVLGLYLSGHPLEQFDFEYQHYGISAITQITTEIQRLDNLWAEKRLEMKDEKAFKEAAKKVNQSKRIMGLVTEKTKLTTQKGAPYLRFKIADFESEISLMLFSEQFYSFEKYVVEGHTIMVDIALVQDWRSPGVFQTNVINLTPVERIKEDYTKRLVLSLDLEKIDNELIEKITKKTGETPAKTELAFIITDGSKEETVQVKTFGKSILFTDDLAVYLEKKEGIDFRIVHN